MELTDGCYSEGDSQGLPGFIHPRVLGIPLLEGVKEPTKSPKKPVHALSDVRFENFAAPNKTALLRGFLKPCLARGFD